MAKIHTRAKRKLRMQTSRGRNRKPRLKTFKREETAKKYAESKGLKNYKLVNIWSAKKNKKKIKIVVE